MLVKELIKTLSEMNPNAEVIGITDKGEYQDIYDCEEEYTSLVTISLKNNVKIYGE